MSGLLDIDPSDRYDLDREWEVTPTAASLPTLAETMPDTTDVHPMDCRCLPCEGWRECHEWEARRPELRPMVVAEDRPEHEPCEAGTPGCCVLHSACDHGCETW